MNTFDAYAKFLTENKWFNECDCVDVKDFIHSKNAIEITLVGGEVIIYNHLLNIYHVYRSHDNLIFSHFSPILDEDEFKFRFARCMYEKLLESGLIQEDLVLMTGISAGTISQYINGNIMPTAYNLYKIAKALECTPNDLIGF